MHTSFSNPTVEAVDLPQLSGNEFTAVERSFFWLRFVMVIGFTVVISTAALVGRSFADVEVDGRLLVGAGLFVAFDVVVAVICQWLEVAHMGYVLRQHDFSFRSGVVRTSVMTIPFSRVQNVVIDRSLLVRMFGLANLRLHSAGGTLHVTGISYSSAESLKSFIVDRARIAADEERAAR